MVSPDGTTTYSTGTDGKLRISDTDDRRCSAWYLRFTKQGATMLLELFLPTGKNEPLPTDFAKQMGRAIWLTSVNNHVGYRKVTVSFAFNEAYRGVLNAFNIFSNVPNYVSYELRAIEWAEVKAVRLA